MYMIVCTCDFTMLGCCVFTDHTSYDP